MNSLSTEMMLLCDSVRYCTGLQAKVETYPQVNNAKLKRLVKWHGLIGTVSPYLKNYLQLDDSNELVTSLKPILVRQSIKQAVRRNQLGELIDKFLRQDIDYAVIKGLAAKAQIYDLPIPVQRISADIDLLVNPVDFPKVVKIMAQLSYQCSDCDNPLAVAEFAVSSADKLSKRGLVFSHKQPHCASIDIHWRVANTFSLPLRPQEILTQKQRISDGDLEFFAPCFEHHFLILAIHGYLDHFFQLKHLADIYFAMRHVNYDETKIQHIAQTLGVQQHLKDSIAVTNTMFTAPIETSITSSSYVNKTLNRYNKYDGLTPRRHKTTGVWTLFDKLNYILRQIKSRSRNASIIDPIKNRLLIKFDQLPK